MNVKDRAQTREMRGMERLKLGSGVGWCEPERLIVIVPTRWSLGAKERP